MHEQSNWTLQIGLLMRNSANGTMFSLLEPQGVNRHQIEHIDRKLQLHFLTWERALNTEHWRQWRYVFTARALSGKSASNRTN